ncbi:hypothetical protein HBB16_04195 [Pseudonocardia sp. MCCB 268]|nr:hypothetical protein [Pseudonocardia cytotoxica]
MGPRRPARSTSRPARARRVPGRPRRFHRREMGRPRPGDATEGGDQK